MITRRRGDLRRDAARCRSRPADRSTVLPDSSIGDLSRRSSAADRHSTPRSCANRTRSTGGSRAGLLLRQDRAAVRKPLHSVVNQEIGPHVLYGRLKLQHWASIAIGRTIVRCRGYALLYNTFKLAICGLWQIAMLNLTIVKRPVRSSIGFIDCTTRSDNNGRAKALWSVG